MAAARQPDRRCCGWQSRDLPVRRFGRQSADRSSEPHRRRFSTAADGRPLHPRLPAVRGRGMGQVQPARLGRGGGRLRFFLLLEAPCQPRGADHVGGSCHPPQQRALQPVDGAAPVLYDLRLRLDVLPAHGGAGRAARDVGDRSAHRPAVPILDAHRAHRSARLVRPRVREPEQPPRAPRAGRLLHRPQLRRHPRRVGPAVRHLRRRA